MEKWGHWVWTEKKGVIGHKISLEKGVYWQAVDIHRQMEVPLPPGPGFNREKHNKPDQTKWTTGFKFKLLIAKTPLYTKF